LAFLPVELENGIIRIANGARIGLGIDHLSDRPLKCPDSTGTLQFRKTGYYGASSWVKVKSGQKSTVTFTLELIDPNDEVPYGNIHGTSSIPGTEIFIDDQPHGVTEATIEILWGEHDVSVKRIGYVTPPTQHVFVPMHESVDVYFELTPEPWLYIGEFSPPIDMDAVNIAKAGSTIPVMWHLSDVNGDVRTLQVSSLSTPLL
jgi:hypothetical protein